MRPPQPLRRTPDYRGGFAAAFGAARCQSDRQIPRRPEPFLRILFQTAADDCGERRRHGCRQLGRLFLEDRAHHIGGRRATEGAAPGEHLMQHRAQAEDIATGIDRRGAHLLRRHVAEGSENHAGAGGEILGGRAGARYGVRLRYFGQSEI